MKMIQRDPPSRECGSRGRRCVLREPVSWLGLDGRCIHTHRSFVHMDRRWASRHHISNDRKYRLNNYQTSVRTIFRFLAVGKRSEYF